MRLVPPVGPTRDLVRRPSLLVLLAVVLVAISPTVAQAHGVEVPPQLPAPQWMFGWGAVVALVTSFVALGAAWTRPLFLAAARRRELPVPRPLAAAARGALGLAGVVLYALTLWAGFTGSSFADANLAPSMVFVGFWVVVPFASLVLGDVWAALSPWRTVATAGAALRARRAGPPITVAGPATPAARATRSAPTTDLSPAVARLASVVAVGSLAAFGWLELAAPDRDDPALLAGVAAAYGALMLLGATVFGRRFVDLADGPGRLFGLLASVAPVAWHADAVRLRPPVVGVAEVDPRRTVAGVVVVAVGIATFDGLSATSIWARDDAIGARIEDAFSGIGLAPEAATAAVSTVGLAGCIALIGVVVWLGTGRLREIDAARGVTGGRLGAFAPTLIPIAAAYLVAHYATLVLVQGQVLVVRLSDPRGDGSNLLGTAGWAVDLRPLSTEAVWYVQLCALVLGHVAALAAAHDLALRTFPDHASATRSQVPMLVAMVALTALGLRLVSGSVLR